MANWKGTAVPNSGNVEKVYFNTNLTVEEVYNLVNSIDYDFSTMVNYYILADENFDVQLLISTTNPSESFVIQGSIGEESVIIFSYNFLEEFEGGDGWQTFNNPLTVNTTAISEVEEGGEVIPFGAENSKLSSLFSITPFEEEVTLEGFLTDTCEAIREKEGTADKIPALDIPSRIRALSSGGDTSQEDGLIEGTLTTYTNDRVTSIGSSAFRSRSKLTSVDLPNVTSIGNYAFYDCSALTSVNLLQATSIGGYAFYDCVNLTSVDLPLVTSVGNSAFDYCRNLTSVDLPNATSIEGSAFNYCSSLTSVDLPNVTSIGEGAFSSCSNLTSVSIPQATSIGRYTFTSCSKLTSVDLPNVTSIESQAFYNCSNLTSVDFPQATSIASQAFTNCSKLTSVDLPNVTSIGSYAFNSCYSLTKLIIRTTSQVCTLSNTDAFSSCYHILGTTNATYNPQGLKDGYIYVPDELLESYKIATNWVTYADQIKPLSELPTEE